MRLPLPLFVSTEIAAIKKQREALLRRLQKVRMDARSRIRTEQRLNLLTAKLVQLETSIAGSGKSR